MKILKSKSQTSPSDIEAILAQVPSVSDDPSVRATGENLARLRTELKIVEDEIEKGHGRGISDPRTITKSISVNEDAERLLQGHDLEGTSFDTRRTELLRRRDALRRAIEIGEQRVSRVKAEAAIELVSGLSDLIRPIVAERLSACEALAAAYTRAAELTAGLRRKGLSSYHIPAGITLAVKDESIRGGLPVSLDVHVQWLTNVLQKLDATAAKQKKAG